MIAIHYRKENVAKFFEVKHRTLLFTVKPNFSHRFHMPN